MNSDKKAYYPPKLAISLFRWYCRPDRLEELEGDLGEFFERRIEGGDPLWKAKLFFWWNVLRCARSYSVKRTSKPLIMLPLFKSYFRLALRHSWKNKWSVMINVLGLGAALSMCIFVYSIYAFNIEFDTFYEGVDDVYRVYSMTYENERARRNDLSPGPLDYVLRNEISGIKQVASYLDEGTSIQIGNEYFSESVGIVSDDFFEMFKVPLWYGSFEEINQSSIYLTKETAKRLFGNEVALGKELTLYLGSDNKVELKVAGVLERIPENTSFQATVFISESIYLATRKIDPNDWERRYYMSHYVRTTPQHLSTIEKQLDSYLPQQNESHKSLKMTEFQMAPFLSPIHSFKEVERANTNRRLRREPLMIFTVLAALIFFVACFNLTNSSIAMIASRLIEIGVRKTLGSENHKILIQFFMEMGIVCSLSLVIGISLVNTVSGAILGLFGSSFPIQDVNIGGIILFLVVFLLFTTIIAGIMPALYAWKFQPIAIMRKSVKLRGVGFINKALTVAQYVFSIAVLTAAISFSNNVEFLDDLDPGYANDDIYVLEFDNKEFYEPVKQKVEQIAGITTSGAHGHIQVVWRSGRTKLLEIDTSSYELSTYVVDHSYLELMEIPVVRGRSFIQNSDAEVANSVIVNQEFVDRYFEGRDPINQKVKIAEVPKTIVGVVPNLVQDVYQDAEDKPIAFLPKNDPSYRYLIAKVNNGQKDEIESAFKSIWAETVDKPFDGSWQKDLAYGSAANDSNNLKKIFFYMAVLGCLLSIAGIFSLSKLNIAKRKKEISIRKVLGSSLNQLLVTLNKSFIVVLIISVTLGSIIGFLISDKVLGLIYKHYESASPVISLLIGLSIGAIAILIIISSILAPARTNPVAGLRNE